MKKYLYLALILALSLVVSFFAIKLYSGKFIDKDNNVFLEKPYLQIKVSELKNYLTENSDFVLFINNLKSTEEFQKNFSEYLIENDDLNRVLFIDGRETAENDIKYLESIYEGSLAFNIIDFEEDNILVIEERKIVDYLEVNQNTKIENIDLFLQSKVLND